jgi:hypothetical protein
VRRRTVAITALLVVALGACNKRDSSFEQERKLIEEKLSSGAESTRTKVPRQNGYGSEASWRYEFQGDKDAAMKTYEARIPAGYSRVRQTASELDFARYDGHDSFHLTLTFDATKQDSTTVQVQLRSLPD